MSSWKKASKTNQKTHRERHQPKSREHFGLLEKKKDYKLRAVNHNQKEATYKLLRKRALCKNPDEFYFHMLNSKLKEGVHHEMEKDDEHTPDQIKLMQSQDLNYIILKRTMELKKIEKLQSQLHFLDVANKTPNNHTFFIDGKKVKNIDIAERLGTHPSLINRRINRPRLKDLETGQFDQLDENEAKILNHKKQKMYVRLAKRVDREKQLGLIQQKLEMKKHLIQSAGKQPQRIKPATKDAAPIYKWDFERKK